MPICVNAFHTSHICIYTPEILGLPIRIFNTIKFEKQYLFCSQNCAKKTDMLCVLENVNVQSQNIAQDAYNILTA